MIDNDLIQKALAGAGPTRRDRVFAVAEVWYRYTGCLPTTREARDCVEKGSYGDVQRDLKDFQSIIVARTERKAAIPGLPLDLDIKVSEVIAGLWQTIFERAEQEFVADRDALNAKLNAISTELEHATKERLQALEDRSVALERLATTERELVTANASIATELRNVSERNITITQLQTRIGEMETETIRLQTEHDKEMRSAQGTLKERENRILDLQSAADTIKAGYEDRLAAAYTLEAEHRMRADRAETGRHKLQERLEAVSGDLANLRGQHESLAARHQVVEASRDQSISQIALLQRDVKTEKDHLQVVIDDNTLLSGELAMMKATVEEQDTKILHLEAALTVSRQSAMSDMTITPTSGS